MLICRRRFNAYLLLLLALAAVSGCKTRGAKNLCTLRLHEEIRPDATGRAETVTVHHDPDIQMSVDKTPFLTETFVKSAKVVEIVGGFALNVEFDRQGSWLLEQKTADIRGKHLAIFSQFHDTPHEKLNGGRWLATPMITSHIANGILSFVPDASRAEAEIIARGLNAVARRTQTGKEVKF
jgi:hypothetical protein